MKNKCVYEHIHTEGHWNTYSYNVGSRPGPTPTSWPGTSISQRGKHLHPYHGMAYIIESSAQALTSAGVRENYSLFLEQDGSISTYFIFQSAHLPFWSSIALSQYDIYF